MRFKKAEFCCDLPKVCITLDKQDHVYNPGTVGPSSGVVLRRYDGANCEGNVNPQNQDVNVNQNGPTVVDVVSW